MAIPLGTTSRQLTWLARWLLAGLMVISMLAWWWPSYDAWAAVAVCLLIVWMLWLMTRTICADRTVLAHPVYIIMLLPALVGIYHLAGTGLSMTREGPSDLAGTLNISMLFQLALLALGIMLTQSLLPRAVGHVALLSICGAAMLIGPVMDDVDLDDYPQL